MAAGILVVVVDILEADIPAEGTVILPVVALVGTLGAGPSVAAMLEVEGITVERVIRGALGAQATQAAHIPTAAGIWVTGRAITLVRVTAIPFIPGTAMATVIGVILHMATTATTTIPHFTATFRSGDGATGLTTRHTIRRRTTPTITRQLTDT